MNASWDHPFDLILIHPDKDRAREIASRLQMVGFHTWVQDSWSTAHTHLQEKGGDFLVVYVDDIRRAEMGIKATHQLHVDIRIILLVPRELQQSEEVLHHAGASLVLPAEMPARHVAYMLATQGELFATERQNYKLRQMLDGRSSYENLIGGSAPMRSLYRLLDQVARTDTNVLIMGEKGTERIPVARAIHQKSERAINPMVIVNCRRLKDDPEAREIFGPLGRGEYGDGPCVHASSFSRAGKGMLVLDEVDALHPQAQQRLLNFLHRPFFQNETPGSPQPLARIMVTSDTQLMDRVEKGEFNRELFYRLNILQVRVPPLRERREDIPMLAQHYLRTAPKKNNGPSISMSFSSRALLALFQYDWPGNIEELERLVLDLSGTLDTPSIEVHHLPERIGNLEQPEEFQILAECSELPLKEAKRVFETEYFKDLLRKTQGNMTLASRYSRVGRPYLYKKIKEYGIEPDEFR